MSYPCLGALGLVFLVGCQPRQNAQIEAQQVEQVVQEFFSAISEFDYEGMQAACTDDFLLLEPGLFWNVDSQINFMKPREG